MDNTTQPTSPTQPVTDQQQSTTPPPAETQTQPTAPAAPSSEPAATPTPPPPAPASPSSTPPPSSPSQPPSPTEHAARGISFKTILLIVILAILAGVLLFVALRPAKKSIVTAPPVPTVTPTQAHSILTLNPETSATPSGAGITTKAVDVMIDTKTNKVDGVQFEIAYDPTILTNVNVTSGTFFTNPLTLLNQVDTKNGKIDYATGIQPTATPAAGMGTVAVISYSILPTATTSTTTLRFLPKTQVIGQGILGSVLEKSIDLVLPVSGLTTPTTATSAAK